MKITICGSLKFMDQMLKLQKQLESNGHTVLMPIKVAGVNYWAKESHDRVKAKKGLGLLGKHMEKIKQSDAILVTNYTKSNTKNYIGANTFLEMGFAKYLGKKIYILNPLPDQKYISEELLSFDGQIINGDLSKII